MQGKKHPVAMGSTISLCDELGTPSVMRCDMQLCSWCFPEPSHIALRPGRDVSFVLCYFLLTILRVRVRYPKCVSDGVGALVSVSGFTCAVTFILGVQFLISLWCKYLAASPIPAGSVRQRLSESIQYTLCIAVTFCRCTPSPSQVCHLCSACEALN